MPVTDDANIDELDTIAGALVAPAADKVAVWDDSAGATKGMLVVDIVDTLADGDVPLAKLATNPVARANHTGTQLASTISDFETAVEAIATPGSSTVINVLSYGATGDGSTSDSSAIQDVIDAAADGDVVFFPPGIYMCNALVVTADGITLQGNGATLKKNANTSSTPVLLATIADRLTIDGLTFNANVATYSSNDSKTVWIEKSDDVTVKNCRFINVHSWSLLLTAASANSTRNSVTGCYFGPAANNGALILVDHDVSDFVIDGNTFSVGPDPDFTAAIELDAYTGNPVPRRGKIVNNSITLDGVNGSQTIGVSVYTASGTVVCTDIVIEGNTIVSNEDCFAAITVTLNGGSIANNTFTSTAGQTAYGIELVDGSSTCEGVSITGNLIDGASQMSVGIMLHTTSDCVVANNVVRGVIAASQAPAITIYVDGTDVAARNVIANNTIKLAGATDTITCVKLQVNAATATISDTVIVGNSFAGVSSTVGRGIRMTDDSSTGGRLIGTVIANNIFTLSKFAISQNYDNDTYVYNNYATATVGTVWQRQGNETNHRQDNNSWQYANAAPGSGAWFVGDKVWDSIPVSAAELGWVCTVAGSPGTWVAMANLA